MDICSSPWLFAAYHVFHRLLVPRHPPCALSCLTSHTVYSVTATCLLLLFLRLFSFAVFLHLHEATQRLGCLFFLFDLNIRFSRYDLRIGVKHRPECLLSGMLFYSDPFASLTRPRKLLLPRCRSYIRPSVIDATGLKWTRTTDLTLIRRAL